MFERKGAIIEKVKEFLKPKPEIDLEEFFVLANELKQELIDELRELTKPTVPAVEVPPIEIPPLKVELERPPLERPVRTFSQRNVTVNGSLKFFEVKGVGELIFFTAIATSENFRMGISLDGSTPPSYNNKTFEEYTLTAGTDPHLSADDDVVDDVPVYKVTIKGLPFLRSVEGHIKTSEAVEFLIIEAQVAVE